MKTGKLTNVGVGRLSGTTIDVNERLKKLIDKGYTVERTKFGILVTPPKKK